MSNYRNIKTPVSFFTMIRADFLRFEPRFSILKFLRHLLLSPSLQLAVSLRLQRVLINVPVAGRFLSRILWYTTTILTGSDIPRSASIGSGIYFPHPHGIVIGEEAVIGNNVTIFQNVTIGRVEQKKPENPTIGDNVSISAGAIVVGQIKIGKNTVIGANAVVLSDVPDGCVAVGVPARILTRSNAKDIMS